MRVRGEGFLLINAWMDFLALWLAACVGRRHFRPMLPPGTDLRDLATLPRGWRLIRVRTAAGVKTAMAFVPDAAAVMDMPGRYALAPDSLFRPAEEKEGSHAGL